jgi:hypothetical protein
MITEDEEIDQLCELIEDWDRRGLVEFINELFSRHPSLINLIEIKECYNGSVRVL